MAEEETNWVVDVAAKLQTYDPVQESLAWKKRSIYRVPYNLVELRKTNAYTPQMISFGPYHHGQPHLLPMEEHKQRALLHFLKRTSIPLQSIVDSVKQMEQRLIQYYDEILIDDQPDSLVKMMAVDGCFMLEILRTAEKVPMDYSSNDPIFSCHGMLYALPYIKRDMLMIENQIPLLVLDRLVALETNKPKSDDGYINKLVVDFFRTLTKKNQGMLMDGLGLHVLDVFRKSLIHGPVRVPPSTGDGKPSVVIPSVVELNEAGVRFKKGKTTSLRDIKFHSGKLTLPRIIVDDTTESMLLNMMAFERLHVGAGNEVSTYVSFMDTLIDSAKDVTMLESKGIILNLLGSDKLVAKLFNELALDVTIDPYSNLSKVHRKLVSYSKSRSNEWRFYLNHTYFRNPWAIISFVATAVLLGLTVAQTVYNVLSYYSSSNN